MERYRRLFSTTSRSTRIVFARLPDCAKRTYLYPNRATSQHVSFLNIIYDCTSLISFYCWRQLWIPCLWNSLFALTGSCLLALTVTMQAWLPIDCNWQIFIAAVQSGFLASLTTVSTFVGELVIMRTSNSGGIASSYLTAFATLLVCLSLASIINGTSQAILMQSFQNSALSRNMTYWQWEIQRQSNCSL